jgi:hypothetical protein
LYTVAKSPGCGDILRDILLDAVWKLACEPAVPVDNNRRVLAASSHSNFGAVGPGGPTKLEFRVEYMVNAGGGRRHCDSLPELVFEKD